MTPYYERDGITLYVGDNREVLPALDVTVSAVVTDPPYGLSFMGKDWDHSVPGETFWRIIADAMKPGAHLLSFGGSRTFHRIGVAIEDAGLELRDTLMWLYGSGFPKSHDVSKAIESNLTTGKSNSRSLRATEQAGDGDAYTLRGKNNGIMGEARDYDRKTFAPATPEAEQWQGWGTALKPAHEPVILARKPLCGTVAANVLAHGTGALNIDASRIGFPPGESQDDMRRPDSADSWAGWAVTNGGQNTHHKLGKMREGAQGNPAGRWPSNVILDEESAMLLDAQSGVRPGAVSNGRKGKPQATCYSDRGAQEQTPSYGDTGGASRFFKVVPQDDLPINQPGASRMAYHAKASRKERNAGLDGMPEVSPFERGGPSANFERMGSKSTARQNHHPTVKPLALMRYLITLITPPGGIVLDPFAGSGSTLVACAELGFPAIGIELSEEYAEIAARRIDAVVASDRQPALPLEVS